MTRDELLQQVAAIIVAVNPCCHEEVEEAARTILQTCMPVHSFLTRMDLERIIAVAAEENYRLRTGITREQVHEIFSHPHGTGGKAMFLAEQGRMVPFILEKAGYAIAGGP
ncbi:MAG: hypothetical protein WC683_05100 [bacterium]